MKKVTILLALMMLTVSTMGCGCCRRLRDRLCRGAYCGAAAVAAPTAITSPGLVAAPVQTPVAAQPPMMMPQPMVTNCVPCDPCCIPCDPCCGGYGYGGMYPMGGMYDSGFSGGCNCSEGYSGDSVPSSGSRMVDPAPAATGRSS